MFRDISEKSYIKEKFLRKKIFINAQKSMMGGVHPTTFDPELRNEVKIFQSWGVHSTTFDPELRNESLALISFMGFPAIFSTLKPFQICIFNRKNSKLTFSNGSWLMGKRFMANLHASLDSTCKSRISKISTRCQNWLGSIPQLLILNSEMNLKIFQSWGSIPQLVILNLEINLKIFQILGGGSLSTHAHTPY